MYGEPVELPQHEYKTPLNSRLPYAVVKNVGECFRSYQQKYGLNYTIFRFLIHMVQTKVLILLFPNLFRWH